MRTCAARRLRFNPWQSMDANTARNDCQKRIYVPPPKKIPKNRDSTLRALNQVYNLPKQCPFLRVLIPYKAGPQSKGAEGKWETPDEWLLGVVVVNCQLDISLSQQESSCVQDEEKLWLRGGFFTEVIGCDSGHPPSSRRDN